MPAWKWSFVFSFKHAKFSHLKVIIASCLILQHEAEETNTKSFIETKCQKMQFPELNMVKMQNSQPFYKYGKSWDRCLQLKVKLAQDGKK